MAVEKERKYLPGGEPMDLTKWSYSEIEQGYLMLDKKAGKQMRVRISKIFAVQWKETVGWLTYKQDIDEDSKHEVEVIIPLKQAEQFMKMCEFKLTKKRWETMYRPEREDGTRATQIVSVDEYPNGLKVIEVELYSGSEGEVIPHPYCGKDITGDKKYSNIQIAKNNDKSISTS